MSILRLTLLLLIGASILLVTDSSAQLSSFERISATPTGGLANGDNFLPVLDNDGSHVAFWSYASNLVEGEAGSWNVMMKDRDSGITTRVSGTGPGLLSLNPAISGDGSTIGFSTTVKLLPQDTNIQSDVYVSDGDSGELELISVSQTGGGGNKTSGGVMSISHDGRFVAFFSGATNLVDNHTNGQGDIFVRDRFNQTTELVSLSTNGVLGNNPSRLGSISSDGRFVAFESAASNLVPGDTTIKDVFVHDRLQHTTEKISFGVGASLANASSGGPDISADGRIVVFTSFASNLVTDDTNDLWDVFAHDRFTGITTRLSTGIAGEGDGHSSTVKISSDGRYASFLSMSHNLDSQPDLNTGGDVFVADLLTNKVARVNLNLAGEQGNIGSQEGAISGNGRIVAFQSMDTNMDPADTNAISDIYIRDLGDWDSDGTWDQFDNCSLVSNADQVDSDADGFGDVCDDGDEDGWTDSAELWLGTQKDAACGYTPGGNSASDSWPPDLVKNNTITISDVLSLKPVFSLSGPSVSRYDLHPDGVITISDVLSIKPVFGLTCTP